MNDKIGVGLIGTGFARSAQAPAFLACEGAELVGVCSGRLENARKAAEEWGIKQICDNYQELIALDDVSLVVISAPPHLHHPMTLAALDAGKHVICEKPMAMNAREGREMSVRAASRPGQLAIIDHELRFNPTWRRMKELVESGYLGELYHVNMLVSSGFRHSLQRPWNWWSQRSAGGGLLGALGSHAIDVIRWMFGEIEAVSSTVETFITERKEEKTGEMRPNETDDYCSFLFRVAPGHGRRSHGMVLLSALYASGGKNQFTVVGSHGTLIMDGDETLMGAQGFNKQFEDLSRPDLTREVALVPDNIWARSFYHLASAVVQALSDGRTEIAHVATFNDGLACQEVIDAVRRSHDEQRWVKVIA